MSKRRLQYIPKCLPRGTYATHIAPKVSIANNSNPTSIPVDSQNFSIVSHHEALNVPLVDNPPSPKIFNKILIANRGEIAVRIIKTCRLFGIKTVAVYSEPDERALHVQLADEAGPAATSESYLNIAKILEAVKATGAEAVHPGYGFLSENSEFPKALEGAGIVFIGPNAQSMSDLGDKIHSKEIAASANVFTVPGYKGVVQSLNHAVQLANEIGYPVMLKASAGGGGKGMRIAFNDDDVKTYYDLATSESLRFFGDSRLLLEKYIEEPRHIEIQLIGDKFGNVFYLPERECSIQRRNQKVIEEAPSTFVDDALRRKMGEQAVLLAKRVGYYSAGTVEFLVDKHKKFYFLEMNTRLQVEHPITELITGLDLVELMLRVAAGQELKLDQEKILRNIRGWAIESRVYAEDPKTYLPSIGTLKLYREPTLDNMSNIKDTLIRCDSGIVEGSEISMFYDPMICKLATWGPTREAARNTMLQALDSYIIGGVTHNIPLLRDVLCHSDFINGATNTAFLPKHYPKGFIGHELTMHEKTALLATTSVFYYLREKNLGYLKTSITSKIKLQTEIHNTILQQDDPTSFSISVDNEQIQLEVTSVYKDCLYLIREKNDNKTYFVSTTQSSSPLRISVRIFGTSYDLTVMTENEIQLLPFIPVAKEADTSKLVLSPMPGSILDIRVKEGQEVFPGFELLIVEAMKMQNIIRAQCRGIIKKIHFRKGQNVASHDVLLEFQ